MRKLNPNPVFYVYAYLDPRKPGNFQYRDSIIFNCEPYLIGKGHKKRDVSHLKSVLNDKIDRCNLHKTYKIKQILEEGFEPIIIRIYENLYEDQAFETEIFMIRQIGRRDLDLGPLVNLSAGGEGNSGYIQTIEHKRLHGKQIRENYKDHNFREKYSKIMQECCNCPEYKEKQKMNSLRLWKDQEYRKRRKESITEETKKKQKDKLSIKMMEKWKDPEFRNKILMAKLHKKELRKCAELVDTSQESQNLTKAF